jgi:lauroyl/myristoyl acyltransferase
MIVRQAEYLSGAFKLLLLKLLDFSSVLPISLRYLLTDIFSFVAFLFLGAKRRAVRKNLTFILNRSPSWTEILRVFAEYGRYWAELPVIESFWRESKKVICGPDFPPREKCFLGLTFHLGNFEVFGNALFPSLGENFNVIAERLRPQFLADYFSSRRHRHHINTLPHDNPRKILQVLKEGKPLGVVCDRSIGAGGRGINTWLFGRRVFLPLNLVDYALQKNIPLYVAYCVKDDGLLKLFCRKIEGYTGFDDVVKMISSTLENVIRCYPYQWHVLSGL